jgi:hypothetical protein
MMPKLMKYFMIPWLDRIVVIMETFRTTDTSPLPEHGRDNRAALAMTRNHSQSMVKGHRLEERLFIYLLRNVSEHCEAKSMFGLVTMISLYTTLRIARTEALSEHQMQGSEIAMEMNQGVDSVLRVGSLLMGVEISTKGSVVDSTLPSSGVVIDS